MRRADDESRRSCKSHERGWSGNGKGGDHRARSAQDEHQAEQPETAWRVGDRQLIVPFNDPHRVRGGGRLNDVRRANTVTALV